MISSEVEETGDESFLRTSLTLLFFTECMEVLVIDSARTHNAVLSGNRSLTQLTSQSDSINIWPCMLGR